MTQNVKLYLSQLQHQAVGVATAVAANEEAMADKKTASVELLDAVVEAVRPALRAMSSRIVTSRVTSGAGTTETALDEPGLYLTCIGPPRDRPGPYATAGSWQGTDLFLCREGSFVMLSYDGELDRAGVSKWAAAVVELATRDIVDMFPLPVVLDAIARAMSAQANGNTTKRTEQIRNQADRLRALVTLVRSL